MLKENSKLLLNEIKDIMKGSRKQLLGIGILVGFLIFILNIFLGISLYGQNFSDGLKDKLGMYFYIKDYGTQDETYQQIIELKDELQSKGIKVSFSSKDDAFTFLKKTVPDVANNFEKYGIDNPLPATLYVMFKNEKQYEVLKGVITKYKDIILNIKDLNQGKTLKQQENRVLTVINFTNFLMLTAYVIIGIIVAIILSFLVFNIKNIFIGLRKDLEIQKILGATNDQIIMPFLYLTLTVIIGAFLFNLALCILSLIPTSYYLWQLFEVNLFKYLRENMRTVSMTLFLELVFLVLISSVCSYLFAKSLNKEI